MHYLGTNLFWTLYAKLYQNLPGFIEEAFLLIFFWDSVTIVIVVCFSKDFLNSTYTFDKIRFPMFMHIKAPDENVLAQLIPEVWWDKKVLYLVHKVSVSSK